MRLELALISFARGRLRDNPASSARFSQISSHCRNRSAPLILLSKGTAYARCGVTIVLSHGCSGSLPSSSVYMMVVAGGCPDEVLLTRLDHDELPHHSLVFVQQHVAVVHVRRLGTCEIARRAELHQVELVVAADRRRQEDIRDQPRSTFSIGRPFASSSTSLSRYRTCCTSGSSISCTLTPQIDPVINDAFSFSVAAPKRIRERALGRELGVDRRVVQAGEPSDDLAQLGLGAALALELRHVTSGIRTRTSSHGSGSCAETTAAGSREPQR